MPHIEKYNPKDKISYRNKARRSCQVLLEGISKARESLYYRKPAPGIEAEILLPDTERSRSVAKDCSESPPGRPKEKNNKK
jgi:hypothetical protein